MAFALSNKGISFRRLAWLIGPLLAKELRVASRRRRSYILRTAYVILLTMYVATVCVSSGVLAPTTALSRAQMQVAAHTITRGIVWFQFFGVQMAVLILMSTAISEEVHSRTLCVLMTTPLNSRQLVMTKFFSRLFQVLLLAAVSLPLLAVVRVLGGINWSYLIVALGTTAATAAFVGAVSLFFSILCRRPYVAVAVSALILALLFGLLPLLGRAKPWGPWWVGAACPRVLRGSGPGLSIRPLPPSAGAVPVVVVCSFALLIGAQLLLTCSTWLIPRLALRRAMGEPSLLDRLRHGTLIDTVIVSGTGGRRSKIRRVIGPPMVWKELVCTLSGRQKFVARMFLGIEVVLIAIAWLFPVMMSVVSYEVLHLVCIWAFVGLGVLLTAIASTTVIGVERESRTWSLLVLTPLTDREILAGKMVGVLRRCGPVWLLLLAYIAGFAYAGCFRPLAVVQMTSLVLGTVAFLTTTGFYLGTWFRRTADAGTANLVLAGVLWCLSPFLGAAAQYWLGGRWNGAESVAFAMVPFAQAFCIVATTLDGYVGTVQWCGRSLDALEFTRLMLVSMLGYMVISLILLWCTVPAFRRRML
jgi:ABC-type transport system involved in multi-copper enzyme maturation permease subunit